MDYDASGEHYFAVLNSTLTGDYQVAIIAEIEGESVKGRFSFTK